MWFTTRNCYSISFLAVILSVSSNLVRSANEDNGNGSHIGLKDVALNIRTVLQEILENLKNLQRKPEIENLLHNNFSKNKKKYIDHRATNRNKEEVQRRIRKKKPITPQNKNGNYSLSMATQGYIFDEGNPHETAVKDLTLSAESGESVSFKTERVQSIPSPSDDNVKVDPDQSNTKIHNKLQITTYESTVEKKDSGNSKPGKNVKHINTHVIPAGNTWFETINNTKLIPTKIRSHSDKNVEKTVLRIEKEDSTHVDRIKHYPKIIPKSNKAHIKDKDSTSEEENIKAEEHKTTILRKAYEDACLRLIIRKCYLACKSAQKAFCGHFACSSNFKKTIKDNFKTTCIAEFQESKPLKKKLKTGDYQVKTAHTNGEKFRNTSRNGYFSCLPHLNTGLTSSTLRNEMSNSKTKTTQNQTKKTKVNILRDSYEKTCQVITTKKCIKSCMASYNYACERNHCKRRQKRLFRRSCTFSCREGFFFELPSSSETDTEDEDDDD